MDNINDKCHFYEFKLIKKSKLIKYLDIAEKYGVSTKARSNGQFVDNFLNNNLNLFWCKKRYSFLSRTYSSFKKKPTFRRYISLIMWAYDPYETDIIITNEKMFDDYVDNINL